jgi:hypothetical protein
MGAGLKKNGTRAFIAATAVCAALSPAALAAVGGVAATPEGNGRGTARLVRVGSGTAGTGGLGGVRAPAAGIARGFAGHGGALGEVAQ